MRRRRFLEAITAALAFPLSTAAQDRPKRVGVVHHGGPYDSAVDGLREGLIASGLTEDRQFVLLVRNSKGNLAAAAAAARELEGDGVDLIVAMATSVALAVKRATSTVPIVFSVGNDPVSLGLVAGIASPGGRLTGVHSITGDLTAKRLELLRELVPTLRRVITFYDHANPSAVSAVDLARQAVGHLGLELVEHQVASADEIRERLARLRGVEGDAFFIVSDAMVISQDKMIFERTNALRMPTMAAQADLVRNGALAGYGADFRYQGRRAAGFVARILAGADPGDLPVEAVSVPMLAINLRTAAAIGMEVPHAMLSRADEVIE